MSILDQLHEYHLGLTVEQFTRNMHVMGASTEPLVIPAFRHCVVWELDSTSFALARAIRIPCTFYGGPPQSHGMFTGTLLTMFLDRLLTAIKFHNFDAIDRFLPKTQYGI